MIVLKVTAEAESLAWDGDDLVDAVGGGRRWGPDGVERPAPIVHGFSFDRSVVSPSGRYSVVYTERGTKALLLDGDQFVRELNRSYYQAEVFDYPVALGMLPDGREVLVHCPDDYNVLEIEDAESGEWLTDGERQPKDVFHSRLAVSPGGTHLLSAGWLWHPYGIVEVFDLAGALADPAVLDGRGVLPSNPGIDEEVVSACWLDADRLAVATGGEFRDGKETPALGPRQLGVWSLSAGRWIHRNTVDFPIGTLIARGDSVVSLYGHPRLIDVTTGAVVAEWPTVKVPQRDGSYGVTHIPTPVAALHPDGTRLAVAQPESIAIIALP
ncbi:hypothetical protein ACSCBZ_40775 [Streptomyces niveiscabiei]|uniref:Secreted protein n=1 Tax=Streptomyces niveiscabiei TaxID=164115 RepID=A0ABW9HWU8_9ACTN|nr:MULTISPECIES: hypothetical protein [Streptomyces]QZZ28872.1 hypothetical protein A7X85_23780 [Streptomyces sp. ST1015]